MAIKNIADINKIEGLEKPKILMVDDRYENLVALEKLLQDLPVELYTAQSGNEALKLTLHHDFALALLDIQMPEMDGYELAELLRQDEKTASMPFIFISAIYTNNINVFTGYEKGAFSYITKPFEPQSLLNKVNFFIEKQQQEQALIVTFNKMESLVEQRTKELESANMELSKSNEELQRFAYVASHDLQEPLRVINSYLQLLVKKYRGSLDDKAIKYIDTTMEASDRMENLINDLLKLSRVEIRGRKFEKVNTNKLLSTILKDLKVAISEKDATVNIADLPDVKGDPSQLRQLFQNLISNGIKFHREDENPVVNVDSEINGNQVEFTIKDNGIGIEPEYFERIFVVFQRLHSRNKYDGTGIGLAVCKKVVERHEGKIEVSSVPGEGSEFKFNLPIHQ